MGIPKPEEWSDFEFEASKKVTEKLKALIIRQDFDTNINATEIVVVKREVKNEKEILWKTKYETILMSCIDVTEFSRQKHWTAKRSFLSPFVVYTACA